MEGVGVIDLFCGIGGLAYGFKTEGFNIIAGFDIDEKCKFAFEKNNEAPFFTEDVVNVNGENVNKLFDNCNVKILVGCAPCQPFSSYTFKEKNKKHEKWSLLYDFTRIILKVKPDIISMENVPQLLNFNDPPVFNDFIISLKKMGYHVNYEIVNCPEYGIPQKRKRLVLLASLHGELKLIPKTHNQKNFITVKQAIGFLPALTDGEIDTNDILHQTRKLTNINKQRIINTPLNGGGWKSWPEELLLECHKKESGKSYSSIYGRMKWDEPSPTMTTHAVGIGNGRFGHPDQHRGLSLREISLLQTFPIDYKFFEGGKPFSSVMIAKQLGNAVPVRLGQIIAISIKEHLNSIKNE